MGLLPFRVAQLYKLMVESLQAATPDAADRALCAGGVMAHYVGDACQPLHVSRFHDGRNPDEAGVHSGYENTMVTARRKKIISGLSSRLANAQPMPLITSHQEAGHAIVALMKRCTKRLPPETICRTWVDSDHHVALMWDALGKKTMDCMADGCKTLAMLWSSAWRQAGANPPAATAANEARSRRSTWTPTLAPRSTSPSMRPSRSGSARSSARPSRGGHVGCPRSACRPCASQGCPARRERSLPAGNRRVGIV